MKHPPTGTKPRRIKRPAELKVKCWICKAPAAEHIHYGEGNFSYIHIFRYNQIDGDLSDGCISGAVCCYSCRAFFRRSGERVYHCKAGRLIATNWVKMHLKRLEVGCYFRLQKMRSDKHQPEVLQAVSVRQVPGSGYEARAGGHQHQHQEG